METYNGWSNYETWRVNLEVFDGGWSDADLTADEAEEIATEFYTMDVNNQLGEGLIVSFLAQVDWREIAEAHKIEDAE